jgi:L-ascorbate metabolism protein UlaG (beta-lactamase superfamily)
MSATLTHNPAYPIVKPGWSGNPLDEKHRYRNLNGKSERSYGEVLRWQLAAKPQKAEKQADTWRVPVRRADDFLRQKTDGLVWLGHCTFLIRLGGYLLLTDPVLGSLGPVRRRAELPLDPATLREIDYILLSHNHRDHADARSLDYLLRRNPGAAVLTGLGNGRLVERWSPNPLVEEAGWWQRFETERDLEIVYLPAMHWARRGLFDLNDMLWGSFIIRAAGKTIYFGADSGYDEHYRQIGELFPQPDVCLLGIGAYSPKWFMQPSHKHPEEAVQAFHDLGGRTLVPMHYGTFDLSDEPPGEPLRELRALEPGLQGMLKVLEIGETLAL